MTKRWTTLGPAAERASKLTQRAVENAHRDQRKHRNNSEESIPDEYLGEQVVGNGGVTSEDSLENRTIGENSNRLILGNTEAMVILNRAAHADGRRLEDLLQLLDQGQGPILTADGAKLGKDESGKFFIYGYHATGEDIKKEVGRALVGTSAERDMSTRKSGFDSSAIFSGEKQPVSSWNVPEKKKLKQLYPGSKKWTTHPFLPGERQVKMSRKRYEQKETIARIRAIRKARKLSNKR